MILVINAPMGSTIDVPLAQFQLMQDRDKEDGQFDSQQTNPDKHFQMFIKAPLFDEAYQRNYVPTPDQQIHVH